MKIQYPDGRVARLLARCPCKHLAPFIRSKHWTLLSSVKEHFLKCYFKSLAITHSPERQANNLHLTNNLKKWRQSLPHTCRLFLEISGEEGTRDLIQELHPCQTFSISWAISYASTFSDCESTTTCSRTRLRSWKLPHFVAKHTDSCLHIQVTMNR